MTSTSPVPASVSMPIFIPFLHNLVEAMEEMIIAMEQNPLVMNGASRWTGSRVTGTVEDSQHSIQDPDPGPMDVQHGVVVVPIPTTAKPHST